MKKEIVMVCLAGALLLGGCGASEGVDDTKDSSAVQSGDESDVWETAGAPVITWDKISNSKLSESGELLAGFSADKISISGTGFENVSKEIEAWSAVTAPDIDGMAENAAEMAEDFGYLTAYEDHNTIFIGRIDKSIISLGATNSNYSGGAHGYYMTYGATFDVKSGKRISMDELMTDYEGFKKYGMQTVENEIKEKYMDDVFPNYKEIIEESWDDSLKWYLTGSGMTLIFNPYDIAPYYVGTIEFELPYSGMTQYIKPEYLVPESAGVAFVNDFEIVRDELSDYGEAINGYRVKSGDDAKTFLVVSTDYASSDFVTHVFDISDGKAVLTDRTSAGYYVLKPMESGNKFLFQKRLEILGTYFSEMDVELTDDGKLKEIETIYTIEPNRAWQSLLLIRDLNAFDTDNGKTVTVPAGTHLFVTGVDIFNNVWLETEDGGHITVQCEQGMGENRGHWLIGGIDEYELFESVPYLD